MRTAGSIRHQLKQVSYRHLKKRLERGLRPRPENCQFNRTMRHPKLSAAGEPPCGVCIHADQQGEVLCDSAWGGIEKAKNCPLFVNKVSKDSIKEGFRGWLATATLAEVASEYPDMAALLWVLQEEAPNREVEIEDGEDWEEPEDTEEEHVVEVNGVRLKTSSAEDAEEAQVELAGMTLAATTANKQFESVSEDLRAALEKITRLEADVEAKGANLAEAAEVISTLKEHNGALNDMLRELKVELDKQATIPVKRVGWWQRLFGGFYE